jgi:hypothetical protein
VRLRSLKFVVVAVVVVTVIARVVDGRHRNRSRRLVVVGWCRVVSCRFSLSSSTGNF